MQHTLACLTVQLSVLSSALAQGFTEVVAPSGIPSVEHTTTYLGSGIACADFDGDGDIDIVQAPANLSPFAMHRNDGNMTFTDVSLASGLGNAGTTRCMQAADIDNDGDQDLYVGNDKEPARLYINDGTGFFTDEAFLRGIDHAKDNYAASFGDYDRDGWLDLYLGNRYGPTSATLSPNLLYRNNGDGTFTEVGAQAGVDSVHLTLATAFMDYDEDGWPDLVVVNDRGTMTGMPNQVFRNNGNGTFSDVSLQIGAAIPIDGMSIDYVDAFCDGGVDFYCTNNVGAHLFQEWLPALGGYDVASTTYGLQGNNGVGWASEFFDYDNDGWQDLHVVQMNTPNLVFHNPGQPAAAQVQWPEVGNSLGLDLNYYQFTAVTADLDDDGRVDIVSRFQFTLAPFESPTGNSVHRNTVNGGNWIKFDTVGTTSNRDGFGARIDVVTGSHRQRQYVRSGVGYLSSSDPRVHFGLGSATTIDLVEITWPSGQVQRLTNVAINQILEVTEPHMTLAGPAVVGGSTTVGVSIQGDENLPYLMVLSFSNTTGLTFPDGVVMPIDFDVLTEITLYPGNFVLPGSLGSLDANGNASSSLNIPAFLPWLSGWTLYGAAMTMDMPAYPWTRTMIVNALPIPIL